ncbi:MAG: hypothetical protein Q4P18_08120 [Methanobrevibacter sp.]|uniref:hypothetical protein n=1 Tax=Methanobrevibacter sp. TaxID=66852 RepID=UPI0026DEB001|nr:hypothetical protein [Methanobrevibacter sp.]MDO5849487.1 hypothetical protein [Methanobrevibacter sp.]
MEVKEILLQKEINEDLGSRNKIEDLFNALEKGNAEKVVMNFEDIKFMSRTAAQEYLNQRNKVGFDVEERNVPEDIKTLMDFIIESSY